MAKQEYPKFDTKDSPKIRVGKNSQNGDADKYSKQGTSVADGERSTGFDERDPNTLSGQEVNRRTLAMSVSIGNIGKSVEPVKPTITIRGIGAAERGTKASTRMG
jgi:hypothetical protein